MKTIYRLEVWNKDLNCYHVLWEGRNLERARIMFNKPYNSMPWHGKKRIVKITEEVVK